MPLIVSAGWDKLVKVWNLSNCKLRTNLVGHTGVVYTTTVSPDGSLCASAYRHQPPQERPALVRLLVLER